MNTPQALPLDSRAGFVTLSSVIILSLVGLSAALLMFMDAWQTADTEGFRRETAQSLYLADGCIEYARAELSRTPGYDGDEALTFPQGECRIMPLDTLATGSFQVQVEGQADQALVRISASLQVASGSAKITEWDRVADF